MKNSSMSNINKLIVQEIETRIIECGIHRIIKCLNQLSEDQLYYRPNKNSNSINNQILHLNGNVRQWLISTMSNAKDERKRPLEFDPLYRKSKKELIHLLVTLESDIRAIFIDIEKVDLEATQAVQCYVESNLSILVHVIEHFSYHVGQITYITKMLLDIDTGYYAGQSLNETAD